MNGICGIFFSCLWVWMFTLLDLPTMESETTRSIQRHEQEANSWRRRCGCLRTSDKLKQILDSFPPPPPPTPICNPTEKAFTPVANTCISAFCTHVHQSHLSENEGKMSDINDLETEEPVKKAKSRWWDVISELVQLIQLSVTATALALYYLIYCYMQLVYYTLRSALYFHNADGAMKITIAVVTVTSLFVAFHLLLKIEKVIKIF